MRARALLIGLLVMLAAVLPVLAQEGHPLTGSWHGAWMPNGKRTPIMIYMKYDGKEVTGAINPGPQAIPLKTVVLDPTKWTVHLEGDAKDGTHVVVDGKLDNLGSYNRTLAGTWTQGSNKAEFKITRD
jgi:hypothetical protein